MARRELKILREHGESLPLHAKGHCAKWRTIGYLVRRPAPDARGETFELSPAALVAIRVLRSRERPRSSATESRLSSIAALERLGPGG